jgi:hypothetical protein
MHNHEQKIASYSIPNIDEVLLSALVHDIQTDHSYFDRVFHDVNETHRALMRRVVAEANRQSEGTLSDQMSFIRGAVFILAACKRHTDIAELTTLFEEGTKMPQITTEEVG